MWRLAPTTPIGGCDRRLLLVLLLGLLRLGVLALGSYDDHGSDFFHFGLRNRHGHDHRVLGAMLDGLDALGQFQVAGVQALVLDEVAEVDLDKLGQL